MTTRQLTGTQRAYILGHINDRPRTAVARAAGVSMAALYRIVRENGGERDYARARRNPEWVRIVRENYAAMSGHEIERMFGITRNRANKIARDLGLRHSPETEERINRERSERAAVSHAKVDYRKLGRRHHILYRMEEIRAWNGWPRKTRLKLKGMTTAAYKAKWQLIRQYGYYACENEPYTLLHAPETRRRPADGCKWGTEKYYTQKYGLRFKAAEEEKI